MCSNTDDYDAFKAGWEACAEEAERRCVNVWWPAGGDGVAVPWTELVRVRQMVAAANRAMEES